MYGNYKTVQKISGVLKLPKIKLRKKLIMEEVEDD